MKAQRIWIMGFCILFGMTGCSPRQQANPKPAGEGSSVQGSETGSQTQILRLQKI